MGKPSDSWKRERNGDSTLNAGDYYASVNKRYAAERWSAWVGVVCNESGPDPLQTDFESEDAAKLAAEDVIIGHVAATIAVIGRGEP